jgi:type I restriction enzyme S subunit
MSWEAEVKELGEVCSFQRGLTYAKGDEIDFSENVVLRANNISMATNALDFAELKYLKDSFSIPESKLVRRDTLMICTASGSKSHLGKVAYVDDDYGYAFGGFMGLLAPEREVHGRYLYYAMLSDEYKEFIDGLSDGVNINNLKWDQLKTFTVPIPPLPEQQRIVGVLDAAFAALREAEGHVERNRANARELFESYLNGVFEGKGDGWEKKRLGDLSRIMYGYTASSTPEPIGPKLLRITDLQNNQVDWSSVPYCTIVQSEKKKYILSSGDIVFARTGATTGKSYLVVDPADAVFASYLIRVQLESKDVLPGFVILYFQTKLYWDTISNGVTGSAQGGFNATKLAELTIPYPSIKLQERIVAEAQAMLTKTSALEATYQQKLIELDGLKKGLLGAAFRGEL